MTDYKSAATASTAKKLKSTPSGRQTFTPAPFGSLAPTARQQPKTVVGASATGRAKPLPGNVIHGKAAARETEANAGQNLTRKKPFTHVTHGKAAEREMARMESEAKAGQVRHSKNWR
jgi:hypothetical protein